MEFMWFLSKKWILVIIKSIKWGCKSYTAIEKNLIWVNPRILSSRLRELQEKWLIEKKIISETPLKAIYCLTNKWQSLSYHIDQLADWVEKNIED